MRTSVSASSQKKKKMDTDTKRNIDSCPGVRVGSVSTLFRVGSVSVPCLTKISACHFVFRVRVRFVFASLKSAQSLSKNTAEHFGRTD